MAFNTDMSNVPVALAWENAVVAVKTTVTNTTPQMCSFLTTTTKAMGSSPHLVRGDESNFGTTKYYRERSGCKRFTVEALEADAFSQIGDGDGGVVPSTVEGIVSRGLEHVFELEEGLLGFVGRSSPVVNVSPERRRARL